MRPGKGLKVTLLHYHAKITTQEEDLYSASTILQYLQRTWKTAHVPANPENLEPDDVSASYPLKFLCPFPLREKVFLEQELPLLYSFDQ